MRAQTRHQLKTDRFTQATIGAAEATAHWTAEHKVKLIAGIAIAAIVIAALVGGWYYLGQQDDKANFELTQAVRTLQTPVRPAGAPETPNAPSYVSSQDRAGAAKKQLQAVIDKYPHTHTADIARYLGITAGMTLLVYAPFLIDSLDLQARVFDAGIPARAESSITGTVRV